MTGEPWLITIRYPSRINGEYRSVISRGLLTMIFVTLSKTIETSRIIFCIMHVFAHFLSTFLLLSLGRYQTPVSFRIRFRTWFSLLILLLLAVSDLDKERPYTIPLVRPLPIPHLHNWRKMKVCLINFNKVEDDERCLKFTYNTQKKVDIV